MGEPGVPAPDGPRLLPDGSVIVPARLAATTFAALVLYLSSQSRANGGALSPDARGLLRALHAAAETPSTASGTPTPDSRTVDHEGHGHVLGAAEAAGRLECTASYVRRLCRTGALPARRLSGGWVIETAALDRYRHGEETQDDRPDEPGAAPAA
ncbi:helix-turn-helix domain-containing protein [Streptomyces sp. NRRL S-98]|uniref:helix-turn-helix domain-containing protein n=1 Tax=unclassified Streptomyces TaxID=2593676 RepID=UPI000ABAB213